MRKLNLHQQSLSRALHRLEEMGIVEKSEAGYRLSKSAESTVKIGETQRSKGREYVQLLQTYLPVSREASGVVRHLVGKWFKNLRWIGKIESGTGYTLQWSSNDGSFQINLRIISDYIVIETNANTEKDKLEAMVDSYAIFEQITKALQGKLYGAYLVDREIVAGNRHN